MIRTSAIRARSRASKHRGPGGYRPGAGRKPKGEVSGVAHVPRPRLGRGVLALVTLVLVPGLPDPCSPRAAALLWRSIAAAEEAHGCGVFHVSLHREHVHLILRVPARRALARTMTSLCVRFARGLNRLARRRGKVFADRYEVRALADPRAARAARRDPCAWRSAPERVTLYHPATCASA